MADADAPGDEEEEELPPEPELTPEEKLSNLKDALANGEMGPATFDVEHQKIWMALKADEGMTSLLQKGQRGSMQINRSQQEDE